MTRTDRAAYPRAVLKDRSLSKNGHTQSLSKNGAGPNNWGSLHDEMYGAQESLGDEYYSEEEDEDKASSSGASDAAVVQPSKPRRASINITAVDRQKARSFRTGSFSRGDIDLAAIARTSAAVTGSPTNTLAALHENNTITSTST